MNGARGGQDAQAWDATTDANYDTVRLNRLGPLGLTERQVQIVWVKQADAGVASGLINTSQQIGGAIGVAVATTIATTFTTHYVDSHVGSAAFSGPALTYGFQIAFYVLAALAAGGAVLAAVLLETKPREPQVELTTEALELEAA